MLKAKLNQKVYFVRDNETGNPELVSGHVTKTTPCYAVVTIDGAETKKGHYALHAKPAAALGYALKNAKMVARKALEAAQTDHDRAAAYRLSIYRDKVEALYEAKVTFPRLVRNGGR